MADNKPYVPKEAQKAKNPSINVRIDKITDYEGSNVKAFASANISGAFVIHGIKVIDSQKGLFVSMPSNSYEDSDGNTKYSDIFHAVTADARAELNQKVMDAYEQVLEEQQSEYEADYDNHRMNQSM